MAKKNADKPVEEIVENISVEPLEDVMGDRYATYAKYVIQDRAIPDVRDGLKPVQRRIIFSMYKNGNFFNKPTRKCAHTVGAVMGTFHPHGDTSIYEALARMSQDWKVRYPLIDFQGNNGSIDGDCPAAYRYTESRLSELSNELIKDIEKKTVDMQLNFDDTEFEPTVLPSRFPNLLVNGTEGIAVALATEIPPHNLREVIDAIIYRIGHKTATNEDLMEFVKGPDFPGGGVIYQSEGIKNIYLTGHGRIEVGCKTEIVSQKDIQQIVITEIPYKVVKKILVFEIDKIIHSKAVNGFIEIRDESDWNGIRIVIDCKKDAKVDLLLKYLMNNSKTMMITGYTANMVAIVDGRPKTLSLLEFIDAYINHQVDVITRKSKFDLEKFSDRLHIVEGLILASLNINEVVEIIRKSKDKADSKVNIMKRFDFSNEQAEAIVTMPLYKLSHTDEEILENEKKQLLSDIAELKEILENPDKLNRLLIKDLKNIANKYGDDRRTQIVEKEDVKPIDKRELINKEEVMVALTRDGYAKRSSIKSYKGSGDNLLPGIKEGDALVSCGSCYTTNYLLCFTNQGNYACLPIHKLTENRWKDEGTHLNTFVTLGAGEKILKAIEVSVFREDLYLGLLTKFGQIKRMPLSMIEVGKRNKPSRCMKLLNGDELIGVQLLSGNSDLLVVTSNGNTSFYNENELTILGSKAGGVKAIGSLGKNVCVALYAFDENDRSKLLVITDKGHTRVIDTSRFTRTARLGKTQSILPCFKSDIHKVINVIKLDTEKENNHIALYLSNNELFDAIIDDYHLTDSTKYAKKNLDIPSKTLILSAFDTLVVSANNQTVSHPIAVKEKKIVDDISSESVTNEEKGNESAENDALIEPSKEVVDPSTAVSEPKKEENSSKKEEKEEKGKFEQMNLFDDLE